MVTRGAQMYPTRPATLRPAGFGWQATRNRILREGVSAEEDGENPHLLRLLDDIEPDDRPPQRDVAQSR